MNVFEVGGIRLALVKVDRQAGRQAVSTRDTNSGRVSKQSTSVADFSYSFPALTVSKQFK